MDTGPEDQSGLKRTYYMNIREIIAESVGAVSTGERLPVRGIVAQKIAKLIGSGAIAIGDSLPSERDLATDMNVSRETVRGAIVVLESHGIVRVVQGARTTVISDQVGQVVKDIISLVPKQGDYELMQVHEARLVIEESCIRAAVKNVKESDLNLLGRMIESQKTAAHDPVRFLLSDREFHTTIYKMCGNEPLADIASNLYLYMMDHRRMVVSDPENIRTSIADHMAILDGLRHRDSDAAVKGFACHETRIYETTRGHLGQPLRANNIIPK